MRNPTVGQGQVLGNRYQLESRLGVGGFGTVWRAKDLVLDAPVALKLIDPVVAAEPRAAERFFREARALASLRSPHVVQVFEYGVDEEQPYIAMELLDGESLAQRIRRMGRLPPEQTVWVISHIARAMNRAHEAGVIHRDLKPENVVLIQNDDAEIAKVIDFGVAKVAEGRLGIHGTATRTGALVGTPYYMSPEQALGNKEIDFRSDLWSLGVIAFEAITGKRPFFSEGLGELVLQITVRDLPIPSMFAPVPAGFDEWFVDSMRREPERRFPSARAMADALRSALDLGLQGQSTIVSVPPPGGDPEALVNAEVAARQTPPNTVNSAVSEPSLESGIPETHGATALATPPQSPARRTRSWSIVAVVAGLALAVGLAGGTLVLVALRGPGATAVQRSESAEEPVGVAAAHSSVSPSASVNRAPRRSRKAQGSPGPTRATHAVGGESSADAASATADAERKGAVEGVPEDWLPREVNGKWERPAWARADEPAAPPVERPPTSPSSPSPAPTITGLPDATGAATNLPAVPEKPNPTAVE